MNINPQEIRQRFAELSDDALLAVERDDLTEVAQQIYDTELEERGLLSEASDADSENAPSPDPSLKEEELVHVGTFLDFHDAQMAVSLLRSAEIPVSVENEMGAAYAGIGAMRLMVPASFVEQAEEVLDATISDEELAAQAEAAGEVDDAEEDAK